MSTSTTLPDNVVTPLERFQGVAPEDRVESVGVVYRIPVADEDNPYYQLNTEVIDDNGSR